MELYDCIIVGASIAGLSVAENLKGKVALVDKKREVGVPVSCGEWVPAQLRLSAEIPEEAIAQEVSGMVTFVPRSDPIHRRYRGYTLNRDVFEKKKAEGLVERGVELLLGTEVVQLRDGSVLAHRGGERIELRGRVVVGCDGPRSTVGEAMGSVNRNFTFGLQYLVPLRMRLEKTEVYFDRRIPGGYGWLFPKGELANLGVGIDLRLSRDPLSILNWLRMKLQRKGKIGTRVLKVASGLIPSGGLVERLVEGHLLLVGDAGGSANPITGAGISSAWLAGELAGTIINEALAQDDPTILRRYETECRRLLGRILERDLRKRESLIANWKGDRFGELIRENWIAFKEYYKR